MTQDWISEEEKELVEQLRKRVLSNLPSEELQKPQDDQDAFLLRWLRARDLNLDKAQHMLIAALKWRVENNIEAVLEAEIDPFFTTNFPHKCVGADYRGNPVILVPFALFDLRKLMAVNKLDEFDFFARYLLEDWARSVRLCNEKRKPGQAPITKFTLVYDLEGFSYSQLLSFSAMRKWLKVVAVYEAYYPEYVFQLHCVNAPSFFQIFLNMLKGVLAPRTLSKVVLYPTLTDWLKVVDLHMDPAILPEQFGGTNKMNPFQTPTPTVDSHGLK